MNAYDFDEVVDRRGTYSTQWDYIEDRFGEPDLLPFSVSDTDFRAPQPVLNAISRQVAHGVFGYSRWNHSDFKCSIQHWYQSRFQVMIEEDWIVYSPTVCYSISLFIQLKSNLGDEVVVFSPMYDAFFQLILQNNRTLITNPLLSTDGYYSIDFDLLEQQLKTAKILLLTNPHNPTGRVFSQAELKQIIQLCEKHQVFLISDDIHMDIVYSSNVYSSDVPSSTYCPVLTVAQDIKNCCICTSMSKTMNTPGLVSSYLLVPDEGLRNDFLTLLKGRDTLSSASIFGMYALMAGYREASDYVDQLVTYLQGNMDLINHFINDQLPILQFRKPQGTYLAWIDARGYGKTDEEIQQLLVQVGKVGIMPGKTYGQPGFLRMNAGCPRSKLIDGLERMAKSLKK